MNFEVAERLGIGRGAEVFGCGGGRVLKLQRDPGTADWLGREMRAQRAAGIAGVRTAEAFEIVEYAGRPGLVMERVEGLDGLTAIDRRPWKVWTISSGLGRLHRAVSHVEAPLEVFDFKEIARHDITTSDRVPDRARARLLALLERLPEDNHLCHMDFHPGNVIIDSKGPVIIDWASARRGDPIADHVKSLLLFDAGTPPEMGLRERVIVGAGRKIARAAYLRGYGRLSAEERERARLWWPVVVGQRLKEGIGEERRVLLKLLSRKLREAEAAR